MWELISIYKSSVIGNVGEFLCVQKKWKYLFMRVLQNARPIKLKGSTWLEIGASKSPRPNLSNYVLETNWYWVIRVSPTRLSYHSFPVKSLQYVPCWGEFKFGQNLTQPIKYSWNIIYLLAFSISSGDQSDKVETVTICTYTGILWNRVLVSEESKSTVTTPDDMNIFLHTNMYHTPWKNV